MYKDYILRYNDSNLETEFDLKLNVDRQKIKNAVNLQTLVEITTYTLPRNMELYIRKILSTFLEECHQEHLQEYLIFCLGELLTNAKKANTKRVYFKENCLDINDPTDYEKGMEHFKEDTLTNINHYLEIQKKEGLYIKLDLQLRGDKVKIEIRNKAKLTVFEKERILDKLARVQQFNNMEEVLTSVIDQTEGAGLGIIIIILMLQKVGLAKENYQVESTESETITRIILPCNKEIFSAQEMMTYEFVKMQNAIPVLKSHYDELNSLFSAPDYSKQTVKQLIQSDITLSLILLSAAVKKDKSYDDIFSAFDLFTDEELKEIYAPENCKVYEIAETEENKLLWEHSRRSAFFAFNLLKNRQDTSEKYRDGQLYTAGLLYNIGTLLTRCATEEQKTYLRDLSSHYNEVDKIWDMFWNGNSHNYLNQVYAKRLGLPDDLSCVLSTWNYWELAPDHLIDAIYIVYLSEIMQYYQDGMIEFYQIEKKALDFYNVTSENQFKTLCSRIYQALS